MSTESMWTQRLVTQQLEFLEIIENIPDVIVIVRADGEIRFANVRAARTLGASSASTLLGRNFVELLVPEDRERGQRLLSQRQAVMDGGRAELRLLREGREPAVVEASLLREIDFDDERSLLLVARDITEERQLRLRLQLANQLASVGTLAAGVAHEINNPLSFVAAALVFVQESMGGLAEHAAPELVAEVRQSLMEALEGTHRIRDIVRDLKTFSHSAPEVGQRADLRSAAEWALKVTAHQLRHRCTVRQEFTAVPVVAGNEARFGQVLVNLLMNAVQAFPEERTAENLLRVATFTDDRGRAVVEVEDNGRGIPAQHLPRIFDPFFTTKPVGQGTGLGLAISHAIVSEAGGEIQVRSQSSAGTCFRVVFPPAGPAPLREGSFRAQTQRQRSLRVLVVDDEPSVGSALKRTLGRYHEVVATTEAKHALEQLQQGLHFDVILCDLMMPHMSGMEFYRVLQEQFPAIARRVVFMTGGIFTDAARAFIAQAPNPTIDKPFDRDHLEAVLTRIASEQRPLSKPPE
jgi:PAS domain S-box-containing protein